MLKLCDENKESIKFRFLGSNEIDARDLSKFLDATVTTFEKIVNNSEQDAFIKLNISAIEKGSFLIELVSLISKKLPKIFETIKNSKEIIGAFKEFLEIKEKLKDKNIEAKEDGLYYKDTKKIENYYYKPTMIIMGDAKAKKEVDEALRNFAINLPRERELNVETSMGNFKIDEKVKESILEPLPKKENKKETVTNKYRREVIVKKTDLPCQSMWELITDKVIKATILDEDFKKLVIDNKIKFGNSDKLLVEIEEIKTVDKDLNILDVHYNVIKVYLKNDIEQKSLF